MSFEELIVWTGLSRMRDAKPQEVLKLVEAAFESIAEDDPRYAPLVEIENALLDGSVPVKLLSKLAEDFPAAPAVPDAEELSDVDRMEKEYRRIAAAYTEREWRSTYYARLENHLLNSDDAVLLDFVDELRASLTAIWTTYSKDYASIETSSAETVVGHRLMSDGYARWMEALDMVESEAAPEEILGAAEEAVRLLVAVGQLDQDVKMQARTLGSTFRTDR